MAHILLLAVLIFPAVTPGGAMWNTPSVAEEEKAAKELLPLLARSDDAKADRGALRRDVIVFRCTHPGTQAADRAALLLLKLPSPLDSLVPPKDAPKDVVAVLSGHNRPIAALAFAPDGITLASAGWDNKVRLWKLNGPTAQSWAVLKGGPSSLAFSPDGKTLACGRTDERVQFWDITGKQPRDRDHLAGHTYRPFALAFTPNGKMLISGCFDPIMRFWDLRGSEPDGWALLTNDTSTAYHVASLAISPDGKLLATGSALGGRRLRIWRIEGVLLDELDLPKVKAQLVAFAPHGSTLASYDTGGPVQLWALEKDSLKQGPKLKLAAPVSAFDFSPDARMLATADRDHLTLWNVADGQRPHEWTMPAEIKAVAFAPDGRHLAAGASDGAILIVHLPSQSK